MHPHTGNAPSRFIHEPTLFFAAAVVTSLLIVAIYFILAAQSITNEHFVTTEAPVFEWFSALLAGILGIYFFGKLVAT